MSLQSSLLLPNYITGIVSIHVTILADYARICSTGYNILQIKIIYDLGAENMLKPCDNHSQCIWLPAVQSLAADRHL
jgi:hypothetical protein